MAPKRKRVRAANDAEQQCQGGCGFFAGVGGFCSKCAQKPKASSKSPESIFSGARVFFVKGCQFSVAASKLKATVVRCGGTTMPNAVCTHLVSTVHKCNNGFVSDQDFAQQPTDKRTRVVSEAWVHESVAAGKMLHEDPFAVNEDAVQ
eukprot:TRINITY_DN23243_c0_g1_i1.p1 TRINITY_DN23243_c0_g1~~TRINITY_DN23243_c0_g1_i1.p1  ORF type:complete len:148 (+),score=41.75 TRINITY_DN23243_c0_g1_i1:134-577(+)